MADAKIHCVGGTCTDADRAKLRIIVESAPDMLALNVHPTVELHGDHNNGTVMYFPPDAPVDATLIPDRLWETLALARVNQGYRGDKPIDAHFANKEGALRNSIVQEPASRITESVRDSKTNADMRPWRHELGGPGSFVGAFYAPNPEDHRKRDYFLVSRGTVPQLVQDLKNAIAREAPTYRELLMSDAWRKRMDYGAYVAERNAQRNLVSAAAACQVSISRMNDVGSALASPDHALPERAIPDHQQTTYSIQSTMYAGKPAVAIYSGVIKSASNNSAASTAYVAAAPSHGLYAFPIEGSLLSSALLPAALPASQTSATLVKPALKAAGWNPEQPIGLLVPLALVEYHE